MPTVPVHRRKPILGLLALLAWIAVPWTFWQAHSVRPRQLVPLDLPNYFFPTVPPGNPFAVISPSRDELAFLAPATYQKEVILTEDMSEIWAVMASGNCKTVVTFNSRGTKTVWHTAGEGKPVAFQLKQVIRIACSPDGKMVAVGSKDNNVLLRDAASQKEVGTFDGHLAGGGSFFPDSQTLATITAEGVKLWDIDTGLPRLTLPYPNTVWPEMIAIAPDGRSLATCTSTDGVTVWDCTTGQKRTNYRAPDDVLEMFFSPNGSKLGFFTVGYKYGWLGELVDWVGYQPTFRWPEGKETVVLDVVTGQELARVPCFDSHALFADDKTLAILSERHAIQLWDLPPRRALHRLTAWACLGIALLLTGARRSARRADRKNKEKKQRGRSSFRNDGPRAQENAHNHQFDS